MKYTVAEPNFVATKARYHYGMICVMPDDDREIRFLVHLNERLKNSAPDALINNDYTFNMTHYRILLIEGSK